MKREEKTQRIEQLRADFAKATCVYVVNFQKVPVVEDWELRRQVRAVGGRYRVVKNTLATLGAKGTPAEPLFQALQGPTALAFSESNPVALAKALSAYAKANPNFTFRTGLVEGRVVSLAEFVELTQLPSREELLGRVLYLIGSPARQIAVAVQSVIRNLASVVDQAVKENKFPQ
ncbi:MAG: 50S ribosomal protein L10 [Acidobacteria bacterium]|nr:50S ribosomal protein L10 [Acidobacteriota bacterium]